ncbi:MAG TPA: AAA family ATPase [Pirellulales bacterium]|nr:AAA family ATPase [Pirellulales bacterium]
MIKSVHIKNFRSCRDVYLEGIGTILALAGRNGAGKTNILEGIEWLSKVATATPVHAQAIGERVEGAITFHSGDKVYRYVAETIVLQPASFDDLRVEMKEELHCLDTGTRLVSREKELASLADGTHVKIGSQSPVIPSLLALLAADDPNRRDLQEAFALLSAIRYYPLDEPSHPGGAVLIEPDEYARWLAGYQRNPAASNSVPMRLLHLHLTAPHLLEELKQIVGDNDLSIIRQIEVVSFDLPSRSRNADSAETQKAYYVGFFPSRGHSPVGYPGLSLGTRRVLRIVASALSDQSAVMLMEQPEDSIHSGLMKKVIEFLRHYSVRTQIIMATHSANVFNKMQPEEIRIVHLADGQTKIRSLTQQELAAASKYVHDEGPLSEFVEVAIDEANN